MSDLFHQPKNRPAEKVQGRIVPWAYSNYQGVENGGLSQAVKDHLNKMESEKSSNYAKHLVSRCGFPLHFFNDCPKVVLWEIGIGET